MKTQVDRGELKARVWLGCAARGSVAHGIASAKSVRRSAPPQLLNRQVSRSGR